MSASSAEDAGGDVEAAALGVVQERRALREVAALRDLVAPTARVVRGGRDVWVPTRGLVRGDVLRLIIGADARRGAPRCRSTSCR